MDIVQSEWAPLRSARGRSLEPGCLVLDPASPLTSYAPNGMLVSVYTLALQGKPSPDLQHLLISVVLSPPTVGRDAHSGLSRAPVG